MNQNTFPKITFFDFPNPIKTLKKQEIFALKILVKTVHRIPNLQARKNLAVGVQSAAWTAVGRLARSTANGQISNCWGSGQPARSTVTWNREQNSLQVDRPGRLGLSREQKLSGGRPGRSTGPPTRTGVHVCARRSIVPVDRLLARSTGPVDRLKPGQEFWDFKLGYFGSYKIP